MKKNILILSSALLFGASVFMIGCKKDDTTAPVVTLNGASAQTISLQGNYTDMGATANDDQDGAIIPVSSGSVNVNQTGVYTITFTATDAAGNEGSVDRTITVVNDAAKYEGTYNCTDPLFVPTSWTQTVTASATKNNRISFNKFAGRTGNTYVSADVVGGIDVRNSLATGIGANGCDFTYVGNGTTALPVQVGGKWTFSLKYTEARVQGGASCPGTTTAAFEDAFVQQ